MASPAPSTGVPRILVIGEDPAAKEWLAALVRAQARARVALDVARAQEALASAPPDAVLMAFVEAWRGGLEVLRRRRGCPPVVVAEVPSDVSAVLSLFRSGAADVFPLLTGPDNVARLTLAVAARRRRELDLTRSAAPGAAALDMPYLAAREGILARFERAYATQLLEMFQGNVTRAAAESGLSRQSFHELLRRAGLRARDFRPHGVRPG
jgi:DNA-binding NtrC family response regulator